jgi:transcriptional regulator with XRE-family HTH domain
MPLKNSTMPRREIRRILKANRSSAARLAEFFDVQPSAISLWLKGRSPSRRMDAGIPLFAAELAAGKTINAAIGVLRESFPAPV